MGVCHYNTVELMIEFKSPRVMYPIYLLDTMLPPTSCCIETALGVDVLRHEQGTGGIPRVLPKAYTAWYSRVLAVIYYWRSYPPSVSLVHCFRKKTVFALPRYTDNISC